MNTVINVSTCTANIPPKPLKNRQGYTAVFDTILDWDDGSVGDITISFNPHQGAKSVLGIGSKNTIPSMNLAWVDPPVSPFSIDGYTFDFDILNQYRGGCTNSSCYKGQEGNFTNGVQAICVTDGLFCDINFIPGGVITHEFGHALGLYHEHQNYLDGNPIEYDLDGTSLFALNQLGGGSCVEEYCKKLCYDDNIRPSFCNKPNTNESLGCEPDLVPSYSCSNDWTESQNFANINVLNVYNCPDGRVDCRYDGSSFDPDSIMIYKVGDYMIKPDSQGIRNNPTKENYVLSNTDKDVLSSMYPLDSNNKPTIYVKFVDGEDWKKYWVKKIVTENIQPYVGINFIFDLPIGDPLSSNDITPPPITPSPINSDISIFKKLENFVKDNIIISIFIGIIIMIILFYFIIF